MAEKAKAEAHRKKKDEAATLTIEELEERQKAKDLAREAKELAIAKEQKKHWVQEQRRKREIERRSKKKTRINGEFQIIMLRGKKMVNFTWCYRGS